MHTLENGRQPREGINLAYYNVIDAIDDLISESIEPDFEKMAIKLCPDPYHVNGIDIAPAIRDGVTKGCEKIWNDYYLPAQKRIAELEAALAGEKAPK